ncbi:MAG: O-antigen ligase family protein [Planctomycetales bacterium]|nr:O-antigen ligase family protein [Planctomycetales bacterium]
MDTIMLWMTPGVVVESALTVLFRLRPTLESQFLRSVFAPFFVGPQADNLYADWRNNVVYGFKAGGLFVNGNIASMFCGVAALLLVVTARRTGCRPLYYFASVAIAGSIFTGSKTAVFVAAGMAFVIILLPRNLRAGSAIATIPLVLSLPLIFSIVSDALSRIAPNLYAASERSYSGRQSMWRGGAELFQDSPFFGLGFGGWGERIGRYTGEWHLPPHNYVVAAWANSGMFTALLAIAFVVAVSVISLRVAAAQSTVQSRRTAVIAFCAVAWVLVHGLADNTTMYGEQRSMILMGLAVGYIYAMKENQREVVPGSAHDGPRFLSFPA